MHEENVWTMLNRMRLTMSDNTTWYYFHALSRLGISSLSPSMVERDGKKLLRYDRVLRENVFVSN